MGSGSRWKGRALRYFLALVVLLCASLVLMGPITWLLAGDTVRAIEDPVARNTAVNQVREKLVQGVGVLLGAGGGLTALVYSIRTYYLTRRGQETDRYSNAVTQLARDDIMERLGGIYALEHVMRDSSRDHGTVVEVLAAYVRDKSPVAPEGFTSPPVTIDIAAAMTVLARRPDRPEKNQIDLRHVNLTRLELLPDQDDRCPRLAGANLCGALLTGARMLGIDLSDAWLAGADLADAEFTRRGDKTRANLSGAWLTEANLLRTELINAVLVRAVLDGAHLDDTCFDGADLTKAWLNGAKPTGPHFSGTILKDTCLRDVNLESCKFLTEKQLLKADYLPSTDAPSHLEHSIALAQRAAESTNRPQRRLPPRPFLWPLTP